MMNAVLIIIFTSFVALGNPDSQHRSSKRKDNVTCGLIAGKIFPIYQ